MSAADDARARLAALVARHGTVKVAAGLGFTRQHVSQVVRGRAVGPKLLRAMDADSMARLRAAAGRLGPTAAAAAIGATRQHVTRVLAGKQQAGAKLLRAIDGVADDPDAAERRRARAAYERRRAAASVERERLKVEEVEHRLAIARELKRQSWERGRFAIPKARLAEIH